ncbi:hypothetical protein TgHK011_009537 [Trichoderma gracile]|nr:hypothetical protein TgHK011_009537 [Trichoderma gracile]
MMPGQSSRKAGGKTARGQVWYHCRNQSKHNPSKSSSQAQSHGARAQGKARDLLSWLAQSAPPQSAVAPPPDALASQQASALIDSIQLLEASSGAWKWRTASLGPALGLYKLQRTQRRSSAHVEYRYSPKAAAAGPG